MKTTVILNDDLLREAQRETGIKGRSAVIRYGLRELVKAAARRRLIAFGGKLKYLGAPRRRRNS
ncbi:MAG: type II toxin-antitoxin system VapB family antitoxin [Bdellovibrionota bacterium]